MDHAPQSPEKRPLHVFHGDILVAGYFEQGAWRGTWRALHRGHFTTDKLYFIHFFGRVA